MKKAFKVLYYIFLGFLGGIAVLLLISSFPITGNYKVKMVQSGSMEPAIKTGSIVAVKPAEQYQIGDIITFINPRMPDKPVTHRIADIETVEGEPFYITQGDANNAPDQRRVRAREITGKVLFDLPYIGYAVGAAKKPLGFMLIIIIPATAIVYDELRKIWQEIKKLKGKKKDNQQDQKIEELEKEIEDVENKIKRS